MRTVVKGIADGYRDRSPRLAELAQATELIGVPPPLDWRLAERLDEIQSVTFGARSVGYLVAGAGAAALAGYDLLRRLPIPVIRDFAARKMIDSFLIDWFGDLPVLLDEPVQAANVRARLARSIKGLKDDGCDAIVIVAHSGGALVSFETLLDPAYEDLHVDKLVTLGQGRRPRCRRDHAGPSTRRQSGEGPAGPPLGRCLVVVRSRTCGPDADARQARAVAHAGPGPAPGRPTADTASGHDPRRVAAGHQRDERPERPRVVLGEPRGLRHPAGAAHRRSAR
jgi:hypothetical protein